jgi:hypothetical protein
MPRKPIRDRTAIFHNTTSTDSDEAEPPPRFAGLWYLLGMDDEDPTRSRIQVVEGEEFRRAG